MSLYTSADRDTYVKLIKFQVYAAKPLLNPAVPWTLNIVDNKTLVITDGKLNRTMEIHGSIRSVIVELLRNPYDVRVKYRIYQKNEGVWMKVYFDREFIKHIGDNYCRAPDYLANIIRQKSSYSLGGQRYTEDEIQIFQNPPVTGLVPYVRYLRMEPYEHQHNNIQWLRETEESIDKGAHRLEYLLSRDLHRVAVQNRGIELYMDPETHILYNTDSIWNSERVRTLKLCGGVLCDGVGLGKTMSMVGLIVADKYRNAAVAPVKVKVKPNGNPGSTVLLAVKPKLVLKIKKAGETTDGLEMESSEVGSEASSEQTAPTPKVKAKPKIKPKIKTEDDDSVSTQSKRTTVSTQDDDSTILKAPVNEPLAFTDATVVLCPRRLVGQWTLEIAKYTSRLRVLEVSTMVHVNKLSYDDMSHYDVVVVSFSLLSNKNYLAQDRFLLNRIKWRRVVVDEGHEVLLHQLKKKVDDLRISTGIFTIPSTYRWVCTGTPLPFTQSSLQAIISFVSGLGHNELDPVLDNIGEAEYKSLLELLFHRNTRESIGNKISIPGVEYHVEFLEFTKTEKAIYDTIPPTDTERQLQLCTNINVSETDSQIMGGIILNLDQVTKAMANHHKEICDKYEREITETEDKIQETGEKTDETLAEIDQEIDDLDLRIKGTKDKDEKAKLTEEKNELKEKRRRTVTNSRNRVNTAKERIQRLEELLAESRRQVQTFRSIDSSHIGKSKCPILGTPLNKGKVAITPDGYYYSEQGLSVLFSGGKKSIMCPYLRKPLLQSELLIVDPTVDSKESEIDMDRAKWGTKMITVIRTLQRLFREDDTARVIIFSQWTKMLVLMGHALRDNKINYVFCRGNVHMMKKSMSLFKTDNSYKVILLSSDACNSGANLTEASHIFLLDAVSGDLEKARAVEGQAIGRAKRLGQKRTVQVHRFVMLNTVEEEYYKKMTQSAEAETEADTASVSTSDATVSTESA